MNLGACIEAAKKAAADSHVEIAVVNAPRHVDEFDTEGPYCYCPEMAVTTLYGVHHVEIEYLVYPDGYVTLAGSKLLAEARASGALRST